MEWILASTWIQSASRLDAGEARRVLAFQRKLVEDPNGTRDGFNFERLNRVFDRRVMSLRVDQDVRAIVWRDDPICVLLYVDHHKRAYDWAESKKVNVTTDLRGVSVAVTTSTVPDGGADDGGFTGVGRISQDGGPGLFDCLTTAELLGAGVPEALLPLVRGIRDEAALDELTPALNAELCDRLLTLYLEAGGPDCVEQVMAAQDAPPEDEPRVHEPEADPPEPEPALRLADIDPDDFQRLLENPTEWWVAFADPIQRKIVEGKFSGAVLVSGGAGTGKTIVAMHRARHLARKGMRVLYTSYNKALCEVVRHDMTLFCDEDELKLLRVANVDKVAVEICPDDQGSLPVTDEDQFARRVRLACEGLSRKGGLKSPYDVVIADEAQDLDPQRLVFLRLLAGKGRDSFMLLGDSNQRIYGQTLDLEDIGISVEGRSFVLSSSYRTTREIARFGRQVLADDEPIAGDLPGPTIEPEEGVPGDPPTLTQFAGADEEAVAVTLEILRHLQAGVPPESIAVFARRRWRMRAIQLCLNAVGVPCMDLVLETRAPLEGVRLMTMHMARGLEFRVVFVVGASAAELPNLKALDAAGSPDARAGAARIERSLLHVSATRATHTLHVSWEGEPTTFMADCDGIADPAVGLKVGEYLGQELDTAWLNEDPAGFRIAGQDHVLGGRQIARCLNEYLETCREDWS